MKRATATTEGRSDKSQKAAKRRGLRRLFEFRGRLRWEGDVDALRGRGPKRRGSGRRRVP